MRRAIAGTLTGATLAAGGLGYWYYEAAYKPNQWPSSVALRDLPEPYPINGETLICGSEQDPTSCTASTALGVLASRESIEVPLADISGTMQQAVIDAEDADFYHHNGVDARRTPIAAIKSKLHLGRRQGASTIDMQLIKNDYPPFSLNPAAVRILGKDEAKKSYQQRAALRLDLNMISKHNGDVKAAKDEILERYLNIIYFGRNLYGIEAAARGYFGVHAKDLNLQQSAYLAGLIPSPSGMDMVPDGENPGIHGPVNPKDEIAFEGKRATANMERVLHAMQDRGHISAAEVRQTLFSAPNKRRTLSVRAYQPTKKYGINGIGDNIGASQVMDDVKSEARAIIQPPADTPIGLGYKIFTTLDADYQRGLHDAMLRRIDGIGQNSLAAAGVLMASDGSVLAEVGDTKGSRINVATSRGGIPQDAGSSLKPFAWYTALENGWTLDKKFKIGDEVRVPKADNGHTWVVKNSNECNHLGKRDGCTITLEQGLAVSSNYIAALIIKEFGVEAVADTMEKAGVPAHEVNASMVIGTGGTSPVELATGYATLYNDGMYHRPYLIDKIVDANGAVVYVHPVEPAEQRLDSAITKQVIKAMNGVVSYGTASGEIRPDRGDKSVAGKTGTAGIESDRRNARVWFTAITCDPLKRDLIGSVVMGDFSGRNGLPITSRDAARLLGDAFRRVPHSRQDCSVY